MKSRCATYLRIGFTASVLPVGLIAPATDVAKAADRIPIMTVKIYNNSDSHNIYPVLSTGTATVGKWLQSAFKVPKSQLGDKPYPKLNQFRIYINPTGDGIAPHKSVTVTLPLYTQLVPTNQVNPKKSDQYIDWWGGGRVEIFDNLATLHQPPAALTADYTKRPSQVPVTPIPGAKLPTCVGCQPLKLFKDPIGLKQNDPAQLTEYTLGALNLNKDPIGLNEHNVDFDVSYVDTAYLPAAMEPVNNTQIGYVGTTQSVVSFRNALRKFVAPASPFKGWPQMVDNQGRTLLKIPSPLHIFGGDTDTTPPPWPPFEKMKRNFPACDAGAKLEVCPLLNPVLALIRANYKTYAARFPTFKTCDKAKGPVKLDATTLLAHVYGWGPFNENCNDAMFNLLENTPGYVANKSAGYHAVKEKFDALQYLKSGAFDPYVVLIHGENYINAPNVYAYSVDDAVGNMQADGDGFIIAVGGSNGLPNGRPATPPIHVNFGFSPKDAVRFVRYGVCTPVPSKLVDPDFASFIVSVDTLDFCPISLADNKGVIYNLRIKRQPPYPKTNSLTPATHAPIDCSANTSPATRAWCQDAFAYDVQGPTRNTSFVITPAPQQPPPVR